MRQEHLATDPASEREKNPCAQQFLCLVTYRNVSVDISTFAYGEIIALWGFSAGGPGVQTVLLPLDCGGVKCVAAARREKKPLGENKTPLRGTKNPQWGKRNLKG